MNVFVLPMVSMYHPSVNYYIFFLFLLFFIVLFSLSLIVHYPTLPIPFFIHSVFMQQNFIVFPVTAIQSSKKCLKFVKKCCFVVVNIKSSKTKLKRFYAKQWNGGKILCRIYVDSLCSIKICNNSKNKIVPFSHKIFRCNQNSTL